MEIGTVRRVDIVEQMRGAYLDYAMSVITARALPDVRDGLKPVQRRILYAMDDMGLHHDRPYKKSARIVGEVLGKYHPHGDSAVYDAMVRMAQDFAMRYPLVDGQGNFGSVDGDNAAAMRYTEARLDSISQELLEDIHKDTVDFVENFDGSLKEPTVLPSRLPTLLLNGASGIAVGMATNIPPHNLAEVCDAICFVIDKYRRLDDVTVEDLMNYIQGPDFPTGGSILGSEGVRAAYATGKGRIVVRAKAHIEDLRGGRSSIIVTELPYQVGKAGLVEKIADLVRAKRLESISDLRDESDRTGMRIVIELKRGAEPNTTLNQLLKHTAMQMTFGVNMLALVNGEPRVLSLKRILSLFIEHRREVIVRRTRYEVKRAQERSHILEGLRIALDNLDEVIATIRRSRNAETALGNLRRKFNLTEIQARAILDMQLRRLAALERKKIEDEYAELRKRIKYWKGLLGSAKKVLALIKEEMEKIKSKYGEARRTRITDAERHEFSADDLVADDDVLVVMTRKGYIKRQVSSSYRTRRGGGRGVAGLGTRQRDSISFIFEASTRDTILCFTNRGKVYQVRAHEIPDVERQAKGVPIGNLIPVESGETVTAAIAVPSFTEEGYFTMVTYRGVGKRVRMNEFEAIRPSGLVAMKLNEGDELGWVKLTGSDQEIVVVSEKGRAIRFRTGDIRPMGRNAVGVGIMKLGPENHVAGMDVVDPDGELLVVTKRGYAKRSLLIEYPIQKRGGAGVLAMDVKKIETVGAIVAARVVTPKDEMILVSAAGMVLRVRVSVVPQLKRGVWPARDLPKSRVMDLKEEDCVASVTRLSLRGKRSVRTSGAGSKRSGARPSESRQTSGRRTKKPTKKRTAKLASSKSSKTRKTMGRTSKSKGVAKKAEVGSPSVRKKTGGTNRRQGKRSAEPSGTASTKKVARKSPTTKGKTTRGPRPGALPRKKSVVKEEGPASRMKGKKRPLSAGSSPEKGKVT